MKEQIDLLIELQKKDRAVGQLQGKIQEGPERMKRLGDRLQSLEEGFELHKSRIDKLMKAQREFEAEIEDGIAHIRKSRGRLMSIKNNKEYRALVKEIEQTEKENSAKEEQLLSCLEELETLDEELENKKNELALMSKSIERDQEEIGKEVAQMGQELVVVSGEREELLKAVEPSLLAQYNRIRVGRSGVALSLVNNATCAECHMSIPPQMYNELQKQDALQHCPHCQRIIYWKEVEPSE